ncbi:TfpX/TfpZ family type IV pilin accessory protein [Acinetobacter haemolyticus]|uniref:Type IV pilin accessory protein n=1 Tax=Acinetobacter haemolyticus TaxID=29430 RepID=A0A429GR23_ACIHA|nr:TfpX/TfpZ family type IV pilin accessory protein [Acinetobacter haemolyticus]MCU4388297.1 type IV pilin accessory protein [Acinetobacter haemolyticus]QHI08943.1 type IV pilin accessory protein [Acinetobacter haemolyticus]QHI12209.1 type IV pilin accessory protein [Acinetobacter haemolyticus]RSN76360.1 type IV pilin accessory protein [Acinetobacter haemolyticus]
MSKRLKFFLSHLSISAMIALIVVGVVFFIWYPSPLAKAVGVTHIFLMLIAIDVVVGPILGFIVYKEGKKSLKFDIAVIIALQVSALCYGVYSIEQGRPAWLVYYVDRFELVRKNDIILENIDQAQSQFQQVSWTKPQLVAIKSAKDVQQHNNDMFIEVLGGISLAQRPERYVELSEVKSLIQQRAQDLELLKNFNDSDQVVKVLAKYPTATAFVPLKANAVDMTVLINKEKGEVVEIVDLRPWK